MNATLKNKFRKLKGNGMDTKFAKPSILGKSALQPLINQSVIQLNAFKSECPKFSKPWFASQVDVKHDLPKLVTAHYLPKVREYVFAKLYHVIAPGSSRNSSKELYDKNRNLKPTPRRNNQTSRNWPASKSSIIALKAVQKADHSRNPSSFSDSKHFVCSTCQKYVFNANHDTCVTKILKEVNCCAQFQSLKICNNNIPVEHNSHTQKPTRQIFIGHKFSPNKFSAVHEKTKTLRSGLRWKPTGRIFKTVGLKWVPTRKLFTSSRTKDDSERLHGSNANVSNPHECIQALDKSACTLNLDTGTSYNVKKDNLRVWLLKRLMSKNQVS
ncbi:hypothetical protein Tco_0454242 [Tanacetum coccineum]